ncbi:phage protease [Akkermansiaceae bacterium]|nr:phage protease [Akkermansiaceae bacterium]
MIKLAIPKKYSHIDFKPPEGARKAAERALRRRADKPQSQRGMTPVGIARARDLIAGKRLSPDTVKRMLAYFTRHEVDKQGSTWDDYGKGRQAWDGWGGDAGYAWARKVVNQMKAADEKVTALRAYGEAVQVSPQVTYDVPEGLTLGKAFKTLALGQVSSRMSGEKIGAEIDRLLLEEMVRVYKERRDADPVIIDWQHATSPFQGGTPAPPESGSALGMIVDLELREDGLYAIPAYNERGLKVVQDAGGVLWSSPEYLQGEIYTRDGGEKVGDAQLLAVTLTPRPAQSHDKIDRVTLSEKEQQMDEQMSIDELKAALMAKDAMIAELEQKMKDMMEESDASLAGEMPEEMAEDEPKEDEEKPEMMGDNYEEKQKKLSEEPAVQAMSEATLLSEINSLRAKNTQLSERLEVIEAEKRSVERREAVSALLREGKVAPAETEAVEAAWDQRGSAPVFWKMFSERPASFAVPLSEVGHGASGEELNRATLAEKVKALASEKSISFESALNLFREQNPDQYNSVFGA